MTDASTLVPRATLTGAGWDLSSWPSGAGGLTSVSWFANVDPTGTTDSSAGFIAAANALGSRCGRVLVPPGKYIVQNLPLRSGLIWDLTGGRGSASGSTGVQLNLPAVPSNHMFVADAGVNLYGGGVLGGDLGGGQVRTGVCTYDCFNFSAVTGELHRFIIDTVYAHNFRRAFSGAVEGGGRDRSPTFVNCDLWYNQIAVYTSEHPLFSGVNDIRLNNYGISGPTTGSQPYDIFLSGQKLNYNGRAIGPQPGGANFGSVMSVNTTFFKNEIYDQAMGSLCSVETCLIVPETPLTVGAISGNGTTTTINTTTDHGRMVGDPVYFSGTGVAQLDFAGGSVRALTVASVTSTTQFTVLTAYAASTSGGKVFRGASHFVVTGNNNKINNSQFRGEAINDLKPDWMVFVDNAGQNIVGLSVSGNTVAITQTDNASATVWSRFFGARCTQLRQLAIVRNVCRNIGQFFEAEGATSIDNYDISHNQWHCNVGIGATRAVMRMLTTTFGGVLSFNIHRAETTEGGQYVVDWNATRAVTIGNVLRYGRGLWTALVNITARSSAGAGEGASIGTSATGTVTFAAGPGVITDTPGFATLNQVSAF